MEEAHRAGIWGQGLGNMQFPCPHQAPRLPTPICLPTRTLSSTHGLEIFMELLLQRHKWLNHWLLVMELHLQAPFPPQRSRVGLALSSRLCLSGHQPPSWSSLGTPSHLVIVQKALVMPEIPRFRSVCKEPRTMSQYLLSRVPHYPTVRRLRLLFISTFQLNLVNLVHCHQLYICNIHYLYINIIISNLKSSNEKPDFTKWH